MIPVDTAGTPTTWVLPRMPDDDVGAVRGLAAAYEQLADELRTAGDQAHNALSTLPGSWSGDGATAAAHPAGVLAADVDLACRGLLDCADALRDAAQRLQREHDQHSFSWGKVLKIGAIAVVSGAAIVVTAGAAAPEVAAVDATVISGEVATAEAAVAGASAVRAAASVALRSSGRLLGAIRGVGAFVRPQLPYAVAFSGAEAGNEVAQTGTVDLRQLAVNFGMGLALPGAMASTRLAVRGLPLLASRPAAAVVTGHLAAGGVVSGFDATRQELLTGRVESDHVLRAGVRGAVLSSAGDVMARAPISWRPGGSLGIVPGQGSALPRQTLDRAMRDGVDLSAHEGPTLGHTITKHEGKSWEMLQHRLDQEPTGPDLRSSFTDRETATQAVTATLRAHKEEVLAYESGNLKFVRPLRVTFDEPLGPVLFRDGTRCLGRTCTVVLRRDQQGAYVLTAFVEP